MTETRPGPRRDATARRDAGRRAGRSAARRVPGVQRVVPDLAEQRGDGVRRAGRVGAPGPGLLAPATDRPGRRRRSTRPAARLQPRVGASAHSLVTASAGSGSTSAQRPSSSTTRTPSVVSTGRSPAASSTERMTWPLCAHGVGTSRAQHVRARDARVDLAQGQLGPRDQPEQPDERGERVDRRADLRHDEAAAAVAAEDQPGHRRGPGQVVGRRGVHSTSHPVEAADLLGDAGGGHRQRDAAGPRARRPPGRGTTSSARSSSIGRPRVVDDRRAARRRGSNRTPKAALDDGDQLAEPLAGPPALRRGVSVGLSSSSRLLTVSTSTGSRASSVGRTSEATPPAVSTTTLSSAPRRRLVSIDARSSWT